MSIVGLDFGSHTASIAIYNEEKNTIEVIADDLGSRTIPCTVAFRGDEIITGQSAISQQHKNPANTFDDVRALLLNSDITNINVPILEKEIHVQELTSHFFRNIHNQIKQQVGKIVRDCIISTPAELDENTRKRFVESAQAGGIRIKSFLSDAAATLMAYELDDASHSPTKTLVVDIGWSRTNISLYDISAGMFVLLASTETDAVCGNVFVKLTAEHCAKDFQRKTKVSCTDYSKSMMRLRRECENAMKSLSTGAEATIDIDSLCEGMDYSSKLTRARFEDLLAIPFVHLKTSIAAVLKSAGVEADSVTQVCMSGGPSSIPKVLSIVKTLFPTASFPKVKFESCETQCIGSALHGKFLIQQGLIDNAPTASPEALSLSRAILLSTSTKGSAPLKVLSANTILPVRVEINATVAESSGFLQVLAEAVEPSDPASALGELVFSLGEGGSAVQVVVSVSESSEVTVEVAQTSATGERNILASLVVPGTA